MQPLVPLLFLLAACAREKPAPQAGEADPNSRRITGPFAAPESALYDSVADVYLVSSINGDGTAHDDNGFITRMRPDGSIEAAKWIDGASAAVTLNAPKGMALRADTLFVADIDTVRAFNRVTGEPLYARGIRGATFLNDVAVGRNEVYVTDSGFGGGTAAVYALRDSVVTLASGDSLHAPNGIVVMGDMLLMVSYESAELWHIALDGRAPKRLSTLPRGGLDGAVQVSATDLVVSSWEANAIFRLRGNGRVEQLAGEAKSPADLGYDSHRQVLLIPLLQENEVELRTVR